MASIAISSSICISKTGSARRCPAGHFEQLPKVTVQLPIFNEVYVVERLLRSVSELDYPRELLQIQVLDDSTDETREITAVVRERTTPARLQCSTAFIGSIALVSRPARWPTGLEAAEGEFVCILDADFVPETDLLKRTIHFFTDPKVGMIQTRWGHLNRGYSLLTRMQAIFLDGHLCWSKPLAAAAADFSISMERPVSGGVPVSSKAEAGSTIRCARISILAIALSSRAGNSSILPTL